MLNINNDQGEFYPDVASYVEFLHNNIPTEIPVPVGSAKRRGLAFDQISNSLEHLENQACIFTHDFSGFLYPERTLINMVRQLLENGELRIITIAPKQDQPSEVALNKNFKMLSSMQASKINTDTASAFYADKDGYYIFQPDVACTAAMAGKDTSTTNRLFIIFDVLWKDAT